jgi:hypothetical protein
MINKYCSFFCFLFIICFSQVESSILPCSPAIQSHIDKVEKIPEAKNLIQSIFKEGEVRVIVKNTSLSNQFGAFWDPDLRIICIGISPESTEGSIIGSILFELQNAASNRKFQQIEKMALDRKINRQSYVRSMEYMEYLNSHLAAKIAQKGVHMGILPHDARLPTYDTFEEHFREQIRSGHSAFFGKNFDQLMQTI